MPTAMPTNGHPSKIAAINALKRLGLGPTKIGKELGLSGRQVGHLIQSNVSGLAIALVFAAAEEGMVDAILDDGM